MVIGWGLLGPVRFLCIMNGWIGFVPKQVSPRAHGILNDITCRKYTTYRHTVSNMTVSHQAHRASSERQASQVTRLGRRLKIDVVGPASYRLT